MLRHRNHHLATDAICQAFDFEHYAWVPAKGAPSPGTTDSVLFDNLFCCKRAAHN
jgi:hypothetical protein